MLLPDHAYSTTFTFGGDLVVYETLRSWPEPMVEAPGEGARPGLGAQLQTVHLCNQNLPNLI